MELLIRQRCQLALRKRAEQQVRLERATFPALILKACQQTRTWLILTIGNANGHAHTFHALALTRQVDAFSTLLGIQFFGKGQGKRVR